MSFQKNEKVLLRCKLHPQTVSKYIHVSRNQLNLIPVCSTCIKIQGLRIDELVLNEECLSDNGNNIITNWPPLEDENTEVKLSQYLLDASQSEYTQEKRLNFLQKFKEQVLELVNQIENISFDFNHEDLLRAHNNVSQKQVLKEYVLNQIGEEEIKAYAENMFESVPENQAYIKSALHKYESFYKLNSIMTYEGFFNSILSQLETLYKQLIIGEGSWQTDILLKQIEQNQIAKTESIQQILDLYNDTTKTMFDSLITSKQLNQIKMDEICQSIDQISNNLTIKVFESLEQNTKSLKVENFLLPKSIEMDQNLLFRFDYPIIQNDFHREFKLKVPKLDNFVAIGVVNLTDTAVRQQKFCQQIKENLNFYLISNNGYSWNQEDISQNSVNNSFQFQEADVIYIKVEQSYITFSKEYSDDAFIMKFTFNPEKQYSFCYFRDTESSLIELLI